MLREEKGITLVALIITIIVLIILAAVTIMSFQNNNLINTAVNGTINYANAQNYEQKAMEDLYTTLSTKVNQIEKAQQGINRPQPTEDTPEPTT